jgi:RimJ/RimL family protein N-acetyltransferase
MDLRDITMADLPLYEGMLTDPRMMTELGGPLPRDGIEQKLRDIVRDVEAGRVWYMAITEEGTPAGTVCVWDHDQDGESISEIGWMVAPEFQGRGLAGEAVRFLLERARREQRWDVIHAFPATTNGPSNAICRKAGFTKIGEADIEYAGRPLRCNHWQIRVR